MKATALLFIVGLTGAFNTASAADAAADADPPADTAATTTTDDAAVTAADSEAAEDPTPGTMAADDTFVPTVEISEDLSVSFPADI